MPDTDADGNLLADIVTERLETLDGTQTVTYPWATKSSRTQGWDPRFGLESGLAVKSVVDVEGIPPGVAELSRTADLSDPADPYSFTQLEDRLEVNDHPPLISTFDKLTGTTTVATPGGRTITTEIDELGRTTEIDLPGMEPFVVTYDERGRLWTVTQKDRKVGYLYNAEGFLDKRVIDPGPGGLNLTTSFQYDLIGRVTGQLRPDNQPISASYDEHGNLESLTPPGKPAHLFAYTDVDLLEEYDPPGPLPSTIYTVNPDRELDYVTRPDLRTIDPEYEDVNFQLKSVATAEETWDYEYVEGTGQLATIQPAPGTEHGVQVDFGYLGHLLESMSWAGGIQGKVFFNYDNDFRVQSIGVGMTPGAPDHVAAYSYDHDGLLLTAGDLTIARDPATGFIDTTTLGVIHDNYDFDSDYGELSLYEAFDPLGSIFREEIMERDPLGRITKRRESIKGGAPKLFEYEYDDAGRLKKVTVDGVVSEQYLYDPNGNRTAVQSPLTTIPPNQGLIVVDDQDRLLQYDDLTYTYSANGELETKTQNGITVDYDYDEFGNLLSVDLDTEIGIAYLVDGSNRRVAKKINSAIATRWIYGDQLSPVAEVDANGDVIRQFVYGTKLNVPDYIVEPGPSGKTYRVISDHLGSVRLVVDAADGVVKQQVDYDSFGRIVFQMGKGFQPFGFAGGLYDHQTGLVRFGARDYDPETGRWTAKDPIRFEGDGTNLYAYVESDPVSYVDRSGLHKQDNRFGKPNEFWHWVHKTYPDGRTRDKEEVEDLWEEWENEGRPAPDTDKHRYNPKRPPGSPDDWVPDDWCEDDEDTGPPVLPTPKGPPTMMYPFPLNPCFFSSIFCPGGGVPAPVSG